MSVKEKAKAAAARSRCVKCRFFVNGICRDPAVSTVCFENYVRGYIKGYNDCKKEK